MSLAKTMDELERHIDYAASYFNDVKSELDDLENEYINEIAELKEDLETLQEQNELLEEQLEDLKYEHGMINLELAEVTGQLIHMRYELDISRKGV
jgi:prefoldin subunit 5